jgi:hypothetical protein
MLFDTKDTPSTIADTTPSSKSLDITTIVCSNIKLQCQAPVVHCVARLLRVLFVISATFLSLLQLEILGALCGDNDECRFLGV